MSSHVLSRAVYDTLLPRPFVPSADWCCQHVHLPEDAKTKGLFRLDLFPHARDWLACCDDPDIEKITIQAATQIGKTILSLACILHVAATNPHPMALADADERSTRRVIRRLWRMIARCAPLAALAPPPQRRASDRVELATCEVQGAWSGSPATAGDYAAYIVLLNETDKMRMRAVDCLSIERLRSTAAREADFRKLMGERTKGFVGAKLIQISTPTLKGGSWIEGERLDGDNRRRLVPCPHCGHFQALRTGDGKSPGGVRFEKRHGRLDPRTARETAWYECEHCRGRIEEHHRYEMLNAGLWVPEGQSLDKRGRVTGAPLRPGPHASFGPLSTLHSLLPGITIGVYAQALVEALTARQHRRLALQNFRNAWEAETWDPQPATVQPSDVVQRLGTAAPLRRCPAWAVFLTEGADVGRIGQQHVFYWWVSAWGPHGRGQCVDLGLTLGLEEYAARLLAAAYPRDGGGQLRPVLRLIDSSFFTQTIYDFCASLPATWPVKGDSGGAQQPLAKTGFLEMYHLGFRRAGVDPAAVTARKALGAADLVLPNTELSQGWCEARLSGEVPRDAPNWYSVPEELLIGEALPGVDLAEQLLGDYRDERGRWWKRTERQDLRDAWRYSMVAAWIKTKNGRLWPRIARRGEPQGGEPAIPFEQAAQAAAVRTVGGERPRLKPGG